MRQRPPLWYPRRGLILLGLMLPAACTPGGGLAEGCQVLQQATPLPTGLEESSGLAVSSAHPDVLWTHNDSGGEAEVIAVRANGELVGKVAVEGARARDWEDLALAPCGSESCLYVADTGDGDGRRQEVGVYRFAEPDPATGRAAVAEHLPARYPGGPRDTESIFVLPDGSIHLVTKGRTGDVSLYRYPQPLRPAETVTLELVRTLAPGTQPLEEQVTGASASPSGEWVAIRSYKRLRLWRTADLLGNAPGASLTIDLSPLGEVQGEAVALLDNGGVVLTSEGGFPGAPGTLRVVQCSLP